MQIRIIQYGFNSVYIFVRNKKELLAGFIAQSDYVRRIFYKILLTSY